MKVSVVIPIYNTGKYLSECLDSVINQSLEEIEIICVNDGSADNSRDIVEGYRAKDKRVILLDQRNKGQSAARNAGLAAAQGTYTYFLDSDDKIKRDALSLFYEKADSHGLDVLYFDGDAFYEHEYLKQTHFFDYRRSKEYQEITDGRQLFKQMADDRNYFVSVCLQFFRTDFLKKNKLAFQEGVLYEDNLFTLQSILTAERASHVRLPLFERRVRENSTMTNRRKGFRDLYSLFINYLGMYRFWMNLDRPSDIENQMAKILSGCYNHMKTIYDSMPHTGLPDGEMKLLTQMNPVDRLMMQQMGFEFPTSYAFPRNQVEPGAKIILWGGAGGPGIFPPDAGVRVLYRGALG